MLNNEILGFSIALDSEQIKMFSVVPPLIVEEKEYNIIDGLMAEKTKECLPYRHVYLTSSDWKKFWINGKPSCWLSFQYLKTTLDEECLIASMRSCSISILASDIGFACRLALKLAESTKKIKLLFVVGSLHIA